MLGGGGGGGGGGGEDCVDCGGVVVVRGVAHSRTTSAATCATATAATPLFHTRCPGLLCLFLPDTMIRRLVNTIDDGARGKAWNAAGKRDVIVDVELEEVEELVGEGNGAIELRGGSVGGGVGRCRC